MSVILFYIYHHIVNIECLSRSLQIIDLTF